MPLSLQELSVQSKEGQKILDNISFSLSKKPSITMIIGPNGAGKTTLLQTLAKPSSSQKKSIHIPVSVTLSYMPQEIQPHPWMPMTAGYFLSLSCENARAPYLKNLLTQHNLDKNFLDKKVQDLSYGEQKKLLFFKTSLQNTRILLLDEPTQGLDTESENLFYKNLRRLVAEEKRWIIMASHDLHMVFKESDQIICLNKRIICHGTPQDLCTNEQHRKDLPFLSPYHHHH